jgi:signal transduction histidine kinase
LNVNGSKLIGTQAFWRDRVFPEDIDSITERSNDLMLRGAVSFLHRIVDDRGLPIWVAHTLRRSGVDHNALLRGCIIPIQGEGLVQELDHSAVSRFIHKIGNHFQLMTLLLNPVKKKLPDCRETEVLDQTIEKSIDLTRAFADFSQRPSEMSEFEVWEFLSAILGEQESLFSGTGIELRVAIENNLRGAWLSGDAALLESAITHVLRNALEATQPPGQVSVEAKLKKSPRNSPETLIFCVTDSGCGIPVQEMSKVSTAFYTTKKDHEGLGLSMVKRCIGFHGGSCRLDSCQGKGTAVTITLPLTSAPH